MNNKPRPPKLREKKVRFTITIDPRMKELLELAKKETGLTKGEYVERALMAQLKADHIL